MWGWSSVRLSVAPRSGTFLACARVHEFGLSGETAWARQCHQTPRASNNPTDYVTRARRVYTHPSSANKTRRGWSSVCVRRRRWCAGRVIWFGGALMVQQFFGWGPSEMSACGAIARAFIQCVRTHTRVLWPIISGAQPARQADQ